jgi:glycosyltransferase involved in cell wall biosynthesis
VIETKDKKAVLFVPFWRMAGHVGNNRVERFVRWLAEDGYELVIIRAGSQEAVRSESWGQEITIVDRLGLHPDPLPGQASVESPRKPNKLRRAMAYWLFNPDPTVVWAKAAARNPKVIAAMESAQFILSSSPPDSAHVGALMLSQQTGVPHIMDMRDGWLDEPLKPLLNTSALRRWLEGRQESRIARHAKSIQVTSEIWKELFSARYPQLANKVHILTNGYPPQMPPASRRQTKGADDEFVLIHAGRFTGSRQSQKPELLMEPLLKNLALSANKGLLRFYGELSDDEMARIGAYRARLATINWRVELPGVLPRSKMLEAMQQADGLLLLSASHAALPSKLFEYLATGLPIGFVADIDSATEKLLRDVPQAVNLNQTGDSVFTMTGIDRIDVPSEYSEHVLASKFKSIL